MRGPHGAVGSLGWSKRSRGGMQSVAPWSRASVRHGHRHYAALLAVTTLSVAVLAMVAGIQSGMFWRPSS